MAAPDDAARKWTDDELKALEKRMAREYSRAARDMRGKQAEWLEKFNREREQREKALDSTKEALEGHKRWLQSQAARGEWLDGMATQLADSAHQANVRAMDMVNGHIPRVFSENANRAAFGVDKAIRADTGFTLVNEEAVRHVMEAGVFDSQLIREVVPDAPELGPAAIQSLRRREVDYPKDMRWNRQKFTSAITQGILQGESIPNIVKRTESIYGQNRNAAIRAARTATTNAENAGRMNSFERAQKLGIDMEIVWEATLDGRTRSSHRDLDGQRIQLGEHFESEHGPIRWPGDPQAHPAEVWCCRCRADGRVVGFDGKRGDWADEAGERWSRLPKGMTYEQWKAAKPVSRAGSYQNEAGRVSPQWFTIASTIKGSNSGLAMVENAPDNIQHIVENYIGGSADEGTYRSYQVAAQERYGFDNPWTHTYDHELVRSSMTDVERRLGNELADYVEGMPVTDVNLIRTNWDAGRAIPKEGDVLEWGLTSTSKDSAFVGNVASESVEGLSAVGDTTLSGERALPMYARDESLVAFEFSEAHALDVSGIGARFGYERQAEVLVSGRYRVTGVTDEVLDTGIRKEQPTHLTPRQYAERNGLEIEHFTSKKGKDMIRFGSDNSTARPASSIDQPQSAFAVYGNYEVTVHHVRLELAR